MVRELVTFSVVALLIFWSAESTLSAELSHGDRILATAQKMISVIESVEDFICEAVLSARRRLSTIVMERRTSAIGSPSIINKWGKSGLNFPGPTQG